MSTSPNNLKRTIKLGTQDFQLINLSAPLKLSTEVFPGDPQPKREIFSTIEKQGCLHHIHRLGDHLFHPHGDAPNHQNPEYSERGFEFWGLDFVFNDAVLIDLAKDPEAKEINGIRFLQAVTAKHLKPFQENIHTNTAIVIRTGYDIWLTQNRTHDPDLIPYLDEDAGKFLQSQKQLKVIGIDSLTVDKVGSNTCHRLLRDIFLVEGLVNLDQIPQSTHSGFHLQTSPIAIEGASGGPVTAYAFIPVEQKGAK
ncbi:cyclase family protein [bacterium]|nr:cyclase family protein [bacterium]